MSPQVAGFMNSLLVAHDTTTLLPNQNLSNLETASCNFAGKIRYDRKTVQLLDDADG